SRHTLGSNRAQPFLGIAISACYNRGMVGRVTNAHMASTRQDLSERKLIGEDRLYEDFVPQSCRTPGRHAGSTARRERHRCPPGQRDLQTREHRVQVHEKGEGVGHRLANSGYSTTNATAYSKRRELSRTDLSTTSTARNGSMSPRELHGGRFCCFTKFE
ncbi:unnamed protein product, partial [Ectocarpus sp. 12 AP-2014]